LLKKKIEKAKRKREMGIHSEVEGPATISLRHFWKREKLAKWNTMYDGVGVSPTLGENQNVDCRPNRATVRRRPRF